MPQLHTYVSERLAARISAKARSKGVPVSRYLADLIQRDVASGWPDSFCAEAAGGWKGALLRRPAQGKTEDRGVL